MVKSDDDDGGGDDTDDVSRNGGYEQQAKVAIILRGMSSRQDNIKFEFYLLY